MKTARILVTITSAAFLAGIASAQLYAASGSNGVGGQLFTISQANGSVLTTVGNLADASGAPYGITGLAFIGGVLYGSTANSSPNAPGNLVTVNPANGQVTVIGAYGTAFGTMSDITAIGSTLYGWHASGDHALYTINVGTGLATLVGPSGNPGFGGGGLAAMGSTVYASPNAGTNPPGNLYTVNTVTGGITLIGPHTGNTGVINSMESIGSTLYGIMSDQGVPANTQLVTINTATGAVTALGASAPNVDALAFRPVPEPATLTALGLGALALLRRRRAAK